MVILSTKHLLELGKQTVVSFTYLHTMTVGTMEELTLELEVALKRNSLISVSMTFTLE
jgi:hypothetical protein